MSRFAAQENADAAGVRGVFLEAGHIYKVRVEQALWKKARKGHEATIAELWIVESTNPHQPAGIKATWYNKVNPDAPWKTNFKQFFGACWGCDPKSVGDEHLEYAIGEAQPLRDKVGFVATHPYTTDAGNPFTIHEWITEAEACKRLGIAVGAPFPSRGSITPAAAPVKPAAPAPAPAPAPAAAPAMPPGPPAAAAPSYPPPPPAMPPGPPAGGPAMPPGPLAGPPPAPPAASPPAMPAQAPPPNWTPSRL